MVSSLLVMGCIQSKAVRRQTLIDKQKASTSNGVSKQAPYGNNTAKTQSNNGRKKIDLDMRSPRDDVSGFSNENLGFAEDLEPVSGLPDTMSISRVSDRDGTLTVSNVSIKQRDSAHSSRMQNSSRNNVDLSIEDLDTDMDDFSRLRPDSSRYEHHPGERINPATTDILLPRRKETPFPPKSPPDRMTKYFKKSDTKIMPLLVSKESKTSSKTGIINVPTATNSTKKKKGTKNNKKGTKKKTPIIKEETYVESINEFSSIEGTIKIDDVDSFKQLLDEDQHPSSDPFDSITVNDVTKEPNKGTELADGAGQSVETSNVYTFTGGPITHTNDSVQTSNKVTEVTREIVKDYLKETDVVKVGVNSVFQSDLDREKARMARKRKRLRGDSAKSENKHKQTPAKHSDEKPTGHVIGETDKQDMTNVHIRPGSKTSFISIASTTRIDSEHIFDTLGDMSGLTTEDTMDAFDGESKLVDLEDEEGHANMDETMDNKSVHSVTSIKSSYGIKPYKTTIPRSLDQENCSLNDIGFDAPSGTTTSNMKTKEKLLYSRHGRRPRPMSESVLRLAGKPPLPPSTKLPRPHSDTAPRSTKAYSRYMAVDTDLF